MLHLAASTSEAEVAVALELLLDHDQVPRYPAGSLLYVDDLVVDAVGSAGAAAPTIALSRSGGQITITYTGTLESSTDITTGWATVAGASSPYPVTATDAKRFYRSKQ